MDAKWSEMIDVESRKEYFKGIVTTLEEARLSKTIYPAAHDVFNAFELCAFKAVKVVIIGQDPYHNEGQAHGLSFSVKKGMKIPPSLRNIYKELQNDLNISPPDHGNLSDWARQGVLLLNSILTVEAHRPLSHKKIGWQRLTNHIIQLLNIDDSPKVFVLWGNAAIQKNVYITNPVHLVIESSHPSPLSARHSFFGSCVFSRINNFLKKNGLKEIDFRL